MAEEVILTTRTQLKMLIIESVSIALKHYNPPTPAPQLTVPLPFFSKDQLREMTGWTPGTCNQKIAEMPTNVVIRDKSKVNFFHRQNFIDWVMTPSSYEK